MSDRETLEELVRTLAEIVPTIANFLASATQHARACQTGGILMQALRARAAFGTLSDAVREVENHVRAAAPRRG